MRQFFTHYRWPSQPKKLTAQPLCLLAALMLVAMLLSAYGVRGTDQYWYLADVITLIQGDQPFSNLYFPRVLIENREDANYFIHNGPVLYLSALIGGILGPFNGWLTVNVVCHLITAFCVYVTALRYTTHTISISSSFLYFISPIAVWQSMNMMQENFFACLLAVIVATFAYRDTKLPRILMQAALVITVAIHPLFTTLAITYISVNIAKAIHNKNKKQLVHALLIAAACIVMVRIYPSVFPSTFQPDLQSLIAGSVPNKSSMLWHYSANIPSLDLQLLVLKLKHAVLQHLNQPYYYFYTNIALIFGIYLLLRKKHQLRDIEALLIFVLALYTCLSILMQPQPRYQQIFAPATFVAISLLANETRLLLPATIRKFTFAGLAGASMLMSFYLCYTVYVESSNEHSALEELSVHFSDIPLGSRVLLQDSDHETKLSYTLRPRKVLSVKTNLLDASNYDRVLSKFQPDCVISTKPIGTLTATVGSGKKLETRYLGNFYYYELKSYKSMSADKFRVPLRSASFTERPQH